MYVLAALLLTALVASSSALIFKHDGYNLENNSFIYYRDIGAGMSALKCITESSSVSWKDPDDKPVPETQLFEDDRTVHANGHCMSSSKDNLGLNLNRKQGCTGHMNGIWSCTASDDGGKPEIIYIYIGSKTSGGLLLDSVKLHWETPTPSLREPHYSIQCVTSGGPATTVVWRPSATDYDNYAKSSKIVNKNDATYSHTLNVTGSHTGQYNCSISSNIRFYLPRNTKYQVNGSLVVKKLDEPTDFEARELLSNDTDEYDVIITWTPPASPVAEYIIYYEFLSVKGHQNVSGEDTFTTFNLSRESPYNFSIVALPEKPEDQSGKDTYYIPSTLVGPITATGS